MTNPVSYLCDKPGCTYVAEGVTTRQALARMSKHWTARDHELHVRAILGEDDD